MNRLLATMRCDLRLQVRNGFYLAVAFLLGAWAVVITQLPVIGTLTANGMRRRRVFAHYLSYGVVVGLAGAIPGTIAGVLMAWAVAGQYTAAIDVPVTVLAIDATTPMIGLLFGLFAGLAAAAFPAWVDRVITQMHFLDLRADALGACRRAVEEGLRVAAATGA